MAFESLTEKFQKIFKKIRGQSRLTEANMDEMLKEVRVALLEADVNFKVVKQFTEHIKEKAIGEEVYLKLNPSQMVVKIVHDELENLLGSDNCEIKYNQNKPTIIMMVGLQGSGKTTSSGKLAYLMKKKLGKKVLLGALDVYRPAAIEQLKQIGEQIDVEVFSLGNNVSPVEIAKKAKEKAYNEHFDVLILDTAGRLSIDEALMKELQDINNEVAPDEILLLVDAMSGQDSINVTKAFNEKLPLSGVIMSKLDGDARGGAALSIRYLTGIPIKFAGVGEKLKDLDVFHPDRMADRILGMGDVMSLVEKVQEEIDEKEARKDARKLLSGEFTLNDMVAQMKKVQKLGSLGGLMKMIPGMPSLNDNQKALAEKEMKNLETIVNSMTPYERAHPEILKNSRKVRIAKGSGKTNADINRVIKKFEQTKEMMKKMKQYQKNGKIPPNMGGMLPPGF